MLSGAFEKSVKEEKLGEEDDEEDDDELLS